MIRKISIIAGALCLGAAFCVSTTSCGPKKDKYYYMHQQVDLQKAYDEAKEAGDSEKMTEINKQMTTATENIKHCIEIEEANKKTDNKDKK